MNPFKRFVSLALVSTMCLSAVGPMSLAADENPGSADVHIAATVTPEIDVVLSKGETELDLSTFKDDLAEKLRDENLDISKVNIQAIDTAVVNSNAFDAKEIFDNWGRVGKIAPWKLQTVKDPYGKSVNAVINPENTVGLSGFYDPKAFGSSRIEFEYDNTSTDTDDDFMGCMIRFNLENTATDQEQKNVTTYLLFTYKYDNGGWNTLNKASWNGLFKLENKGFKDDTDKLARFKRLATNVNLAWSRNTYSRYKVICEGNNIKIYKATYPSKPVEGTPLNWQLMIDYTDTVDPIETGSYGFFSLSQANATYCNIMAQTSNEMSLLQTLMNTTWRENAYHFLINADTSINRDFTQPSTYGEVLSRLMNDSIHLVQWGSDENEAVMTKFITENGNKGLFTANTEYEALLDQAADYIRSVTVSESNDKDYVLVGSDVNFIVTPEDIKTDTADEAFPDGRWKIIHNKNYFENPQYIYDKNGLFLSDLEINVDNPGSYDVFFENRLVKTIYAHRAPIANFSAVVSGTSISMTSTSYDLDDSTDIGLGVGIAAEEWSYLEVGTGEWHNGKLTKMEPNSEYVVMLRVKDNQGAWGAPATKKFSSDAVTKTPPVASFNFKNAIISKFGVVEMTDGSYDPKGLALTKYAWSVMKDGVMVAVENKPNFFIPTVDIGKYGSGDYTYKLVVTNADNLDSKVYTKTLTVVDDVVGPAITINNNSRWTNEDAIPLGFMDENSGLKRYQWCISDTTEPGEYSEFIALTGNEYEDEIPFELDMGYVHVRAEDNAGNIGYFYQRVQKDMEVPEILSHDSLVNNAPIAVPVTNQNVLVKFHYNDIPSGFGRIEYWYQYDKGTVYTSYADSIVINKTTTEPIHVVLYSGAGNASEEYLVNDFWVDKEAPVIEMTDIPAFIKEPMDVEISVSDNLAGMTAEYVNSTGSLSGVIDELDSENNVISTTIVLDEEGAFQLKVTAVDAVGNKTTVVKNYVYDETAPVVNDVFVSKDSSDKKTIHIDANDGNAGIGKIEVSINDEEPIVLPEGETSFDVPPDFTGKVTITVTDKAGNEIVYEEDNIVLEDEDPTLDVSDVAGWHNEPVTVTVTASDNNSLKSVEWTTDEDEPQSGIKTFRTTIQGPVEETEPDDETQDIPDPDAANEPDALIADDTEDTEEPDDTEDTEEPDEPEEPVVEDEIQTFDFELVNEGVYNLTVQAKDTSGNTVEVEREIKIDMTKPEIESVSVSVINIPTRGTISTNKAVKISVTAADELSGIRETQYRYMDGDWTALNGDLVMLQEYNGPVEFRTIDNAGNISDIWTENVVIDRTAPVVNMPELDGWTDGKPAFTVVVDGEDHYKVTFETDEEVPQTGVAGKDDSIELGNSGSYNVKVTVEDDSGNKTTITVPVQVDNEDGFAAPVVDTHGYEDGAVSEDDVTITVESEYIPASGIKKYQYSTDNGETWNDGYFFADKDTPFEGDVIFRAESNTGMHSEPTEPVHVIVNGSYTVIFETNGGAAIDSVKVKNGGTIGELPVPEKPGYKFEGWYTDDGLTAAFDENTEITGNTTLYAKWTQIYTGGSSSGSSSGGSSKPSVNIDTDKDGKPDLNIDTDKDGKPDLNIDTNGDRKPDLNIDTDGDGKPDVNIDTDGDKKPDLNVDIDKDGKPDINIDVDGDGKPDVNIDLDGDKKPDLNIDTDGDGKADLNVDTDGDKKPDLNVDTDKDGKPDLNVDTNGDGKADLNVDTTGDGKPDLNVDTDNDGKSDINIDTDGDGKADTNIDTDGDGKPDVNVDTDGDGVPDANLDPDRMPNKKPDVSDLLDLDKHILYIIGRPGDLAAPYGDITRAEVAQIFYRLLTDEARAKYNVGDIEFTDMIGSEWHYEAVRTLANAGILMGYPDGTFGADKPITRAEYAAIICRFTGETEYVGENKFSDIADDWACTYINIIASKDFANGYLDGTYKPASNISRAEAIKLTNRLLGRSYDECKAQIESPKQFVDNQDINAWYYGDIVEATNEHTVK